MTTRHRLLATACIGLVALVGAPVADARAQSADLVLCDRIAADPSDPDKPADVKGVAEIAAGDVATAIKFCKVAAAGSRRAQYALGRAYAANRQPAEAAAAFRRAADKGSSAAMVELGLLYATGTGVAKNDEQARKLFEKAAEAGNPRGVTNLAALSGGAGVGAGAAGADPARQRALLAKAADAGNPEAQYQLGLLLAAGQGGAPDAAGARALFEKAAAQDHAAALERAGFFAAEGLGGDKDTTAAKAYYERAVALGNADAKPALERLRCPHVIKNKQGQVMTTLCW
ncbi:tetratricopeptide repeat protein [Rhodoplanes azumiensis]|uniref:Tetratricopeptide repeat protein n=1 Tax=Rhodoplanes azumiensis TaxID=1897628 RepID=A0ABW5AE29_9BRAD